MRESRKSGTHGRRMFEERD